MSLFRVPSPVAVFECRCADTVVGQSVFVVGSCSELGHWNVVCATALITSAREFPLWRSCVFHLDSVKPGDTVEFKFFVASNKEGSELTRAPKWESCCNRRFRCPKPGQLARVVARFGANSSVAVSLTETSAAAAPFDTATVDEDPTLPSVAEQPPPPPAVAPVDSSVKCSRTEKYPAALSRPRSPSASVVKFEAPGAVIARLSASERIPEIYSQLIDGHKHASSLRERLCLVRNLLQTFPADRLPSHGSGTEWPALLQTVAGVGVYLYWVATRVLPCHEDGRHYRPNASSLPARDIVDQLEGWARQTKKIEMHSWEADLLVFFCRQFFTCLPSFNSQFTCSVPLTRIRDIAHRNDIPQELKREIKTRLQNKLHRCAGPEDLSTCEEMLSKFHANRAAYPEPFIHEFELFHEELVDFFNARDLGGRLHHLLREDGIDGAVKDAISSFLERQRRGQGNIPDVMDTLGVATDLRFALLHQISAADEDPKMGAKYSFYHRDPALGQQLRIADEQATKYVFVLMSRVANEMEKVADSHPFGKQDEASQHSWIHTGLTVLGRALHNLAACGLATTYCCALRKEVVVAAEALNAADRYSLLHVASITRRILRLTQAFSDLVMTVLARDFTRQLGRGLDMPDVRMATVYAEGVVRATIAFQTSRVASVLLRTVESDLLQQPPYTVICDGEAKGMFMTAEDLEAFELTFVTEAKHLGCPASGGNFPVALLIHRATGDEELEGIDQRLTAKFKTEGFSNVSVELRGLAVCQDIPALSHLGVRARQAKLPFVAISSSATGNELEFANMQQRWAGQTVCFSTRQARPFSDALRSQPVSPKAPSPPLRKPSVLLRPHLTDQFQVVAGPGQITTATCGAKAATCQTLFELVSRIVNPESTGSNGPSISPSCSAPPCLAIPFGGFDAALGWQPHDTHMAVRQLATDVQILSGKALSIAIAQLQWLIVDKLEADPGCLMLLRQQIADHILRPMAVELGTAVLRCRQLDLMVRSSSNVEDTESMSGAGLYESLPAAVTWNADTSASGLATSLDVGDLWKKIKMVWASLYTERAIMARRGANVKGPAMAVLIQPFVAASWSFVAHTRLPRGFGTGETTPPEDFMYVEVAKGVGEALAGGAVQLGGGRATRLIIGSSASTVHCLGLWDMWGWFTPTFNQPIFGTLIVDDMRAAGPAASQGMRSPSGSPRGSSSGISLLSRIQVLSDGGAVGVEQRETPGQLMLSLATNETTRAFWNAMADKLRKLKQLEALFGRPQDIEGCLMETIDPISGSLSHRLVVIQSRPQPLG